jgi:WD40 repeat protein
MATLLVLAVVAGVIALDQRNQARGQADTAAAQRLGAQALATDEIDRSLLLARQGVALEDSVQTRGNLLGALLKSPAVTGILPVGARVAGLALSPDERRLAVKDTEANLVVFDTATRRTPEQSRVLLGSQVPAALDFDPRGSRLALGGMQPTVMDTRTWREVARPRTSAEAFDIRFSTDGQTLFATLFTGSAAVALQSFDARTGVPLHDPQLLDRRFQRPATLLVARDGRRVVTNLVGRSIVVHDARTLQPLRRLGLRAETIALSPDDRTLLVGSSTGSVRFVDLATGRVRPATGRHGGAVSAAVFSVDGRTVATAGADNRILIWDVDSGTVRETLTGHTRMITGLALSHDGGTLYSGALDGKVLIWDLAGDRRLGRPVALRPFVRGLERETGFPFPAVGTQAVSPDGATLAVGNDDGTVTLVDVRTLRRSTVRPNGDAAVLSLGYMPDGRLLVTDVRASAVMFDPRTGRAGPPLAGFGAAASPTFSADGRLMVASGRDVIRLRRLVHGRPVGRPRPYRSPSLAENAVLSPDGRDIAVTTEAGIEIVDAGTLRRRFVLPDSTSMITATTFTPDGRFFVTGNLEGSVRLWSTQTWEPARLKLPTETEEVLSLSVSPDSRLLATGSADGTIRLFDLPTRKPLGGPLPGLPNTFTSPLFTPDGAYLFAISAGGQAVRWDIRLSAWARHACMVAGRPLTRAEWADALPGRTYAPACTR